MILKQAIILLYKKVIFSPYYAVWENISIIVKMYSSNNLILVK